MSTPPLVTMRYDERAGSYPHAIVTTGTKLTFLAKRDGDSPFLRVHSPCCSARLQPLPKNKTVWLCSGCKRAAVEAASFYPDWRFVAAELDSYLLTVAQVYYDPFAAAILAAEVRDELAAYFAQPQA